MSKNTDPKKQNLKKAARHLGSELVTSNGNLSDTPDKNSVETSPPTKAPVRTSMGKIILVVSIVVVVSIVAATLLLLWESQNSPGPKIASQRLAQVVEVQGTVRVIRPAIVISSNVEISTFLERGFSVGDGDIIDATAGSVTFSSVSGGGKCLRIENRRVHFSVELLDVQGFTCPASIAATALNSNTTLDTSSPTKSIPTTNPTKPTILTPQGKLFETRPYFSWTGLPNVSSYKLTLITLDEAERTISTTATSLAYPFTNALTPGKTYLVKVAAILTTGTANISEDVQFNLVEQSEITNLAQRLQALQTPVCLSQGIAEQTCIYLRANVYFAEGYFYTAYTELETLINKEPTDPTYRILLGDVFLKFRLYNQAQQSYDESIRLLDHTPNSGKFNRANALVGQARVYSAIQNQAAARSKLEQALQLYQEIGDQTSIEGVEKLLQKSF